MLGVRDIFRGKLVPIAELWFRGRREGEGGNRCLNADYESIG